MQIKYKPALSMKSFAKSISIQLMVGWMLSGMIPFTLVTLIYDFTITVNQWICLAGCMTASFFGYFSFRKLHVFPGLTSGSYVLAAFSASYFILSFIFLMMRIDYSRIQILMSYVLVNAFYAIIYTFSIKHRQLVFGFVPGGKADHLPETNHVRWINIKDEVVNILTLNGVIADFDFDHDREAASRISSFALSGIPVYPVSDVREQLTGRVEIRHLSENTLGSLNPNDIYLQFKGLVDRVAAVVLIVLLAPIMLVIGLMIRLGSKGPAIFRQQRTGFRGIPFTVFKFRTMQVLQTETCDRQRAITLSNDPRVTKLGRFLRRSRLDELPQLINIAFGHMSFIGPRPEAIALSLWYEQEIPFYHYRHIIKPGLTGWAQVNQGHVADIDDIYIKLHLDFYYVKYFSFWLDILIILRTIKIMATGVGAK